MTDHCRNPKLFEEREARLYRLLQLNAPMVIIARESLLVSEAFAGGMWRHVWSCAKDAVRRTWFWHVSTPFWRFACRTGMWHLGQETGGDGCPFCGKGEPHDTECCECEMEDDR